ncbi:hypothetical protein [Cohnella thailandensis]|uniref:Amidase n=1 Tax=Cohnella thailandensis TaxID=557557 RepID=A0A841SV30_9BACL|nr:hypothetical protein [Cohnella thailandensis]MBB6634849.1 hypothetical protein [Cohnella thailandensis]MBP1975930.1 hypothetical protein [Cohnella thailandensis]
MLSFFKPLSAVVAATAIAAGTPTPSGAAEYPRATWLWDTPLIGSEAADILDFATGNGLNTIYLQINRDVKDDDYKSFIQAAGELGIEVHALDGRASWGFVKSRPNIDASLDWLRDYQESAAAEEKFKGIHVDIEPYSLPGWSSGGSDFIPQWQSNVRYIASRADQLELPVHADIPFWLYNYKTPEGNETLSRWMMRQYDGVTIMAYRDSAQTIAGAADKELEEAADLGVPAMIGVETLATAEGASITFYGEGRSYLSGQLRQAERLLSGRNAFSGFAIHEYGAWRAMKE